METWTSLLGFIAVMIGISIIAFLAGVLIIILAVIKTVKGEKRIGRIVTGGIIVLLSLPVFAGSVVMFITGAASKKQLDDPDTQKYGNAITDAFEDNDPYALAELCAYEGYTGDALTYDDALDIFDYMDGEVITATYIVKGTSHRNNYSMITYDYLVTTDEHKTYDIIIHCMTDGPDSSYMGIQNVKIKYEGKLREEYGEKPDFDN